MAKNEIDYSVLNFDDLTEQQQIALTKQMAKTANSRLTKIRKAGYSDLIFGETKHYLREQKRKTFDVNAKHDYKYQLRAEFKTLQNFLAGDTTLTEIKKASKRKAEFFRDEKGLNIPKGKELQFNLFIHSDSWRKMKEIFGSGITLEDLKDKMKNASLDEIQKAFDSFLDGEVSKEEYLQAQTHGDILQLYGEEEDEN